MYQINYCTKSRVKLTFGKEFKSLHWAYYSFLSA